MLIHLFYFCIPHFAPTRTGQVPCRDITSGFLLLSKLNQKIADPLRDFDSTPKAGKTVAPPFATLLNYIIRYVKSNIYSTIFYKKLM